MRIRRRGAPGTTQTALTTQRGRMQALGGASSVSTISSTVTITLRAASAASFCTPRMPHSNTLPRRSACCAWITVTSGLTAGEVARVCPV